MLLIYPAGVSNGYIKFEKNINHSGGSDLLFYPELVGLPSNATIDEIVDLAMKEIEE